MGRDAVSAEKRAICIDNNKKSVVNFTFMLLTATLRVGAV